MQVSGHEAAYSREVRIDKEHELSMYVWLTQLLVQ